VPSGKVSGKNCPTATDDTTKALLGAIAGGGALAGLIEFENKKLLLNIDRSFKFVLFILD